MVKVVMREERTSRCGWEVLSLGRRHHSYKGDQDDSEIQNQPSIFKERCNRGVLSWLNLMSDNGADNRSGNFSLARSLPRLDTSRENLFLNQSGSRSRSRDSETNQSGARIRSRAQELCDKWNGLSLDIDEILEAPLDTNLNQTATATIERDFQPFIQTEQGVVPQGFKAEPLHLFHTIRNRKHVLHCYEFLLMQTLEDDEGLWRKLCDRFGHCDQCEIEGCNPRSGKHSHTHYTKDPFSLNSIHPDLWFLAITLKESKDKLIHFIRSELPKRREEILHMPGSKILRSTSFLSSYLSSFNFVEMYLDSIFRFGETSYLPKELFQCLNVKTLSLRNNFLDSLPPDIGRLFKLERLFLTNNKLQNKSIPFTIAFCQNLTELYIDNNLLDALPGIFLRISSLERVHRHGNHNYFKATFMWYHTDVNDRILECPGQPEPIMSIPKSLQNLSAKSVIKSRINFYKTYQIPSRIKNYISSICEGLELCSNCSTPHPQDAPSFKVFTFKNPYLGNTCVPFQHWTCSFHCAREVEVPARREQVDQAKLQDREYERYVRESLSRLRPSQRTLSASSLIIRESSGSGTNGERSETGSVSGGSVNFPDKSGTNERDHVSCGIL